MQTSSVSSKGQVVIPKSVRERLGLRPGTQVQFVEEDGSVRLSVLKRGKGAGSSIAEGLGLAGYKGPRISEADMRAAIRRKAGKHA